jgi:hypothetical protein
MIRFVSRDTRRSEGVELIAGSVTGILTNTYDLTNTFCTVPERRTYIVIRFSLGFLDLAGSHKNYE